MTPERWQRIGELFEAAVRIDPAERAAWLRDACGGDDELRTEVGRLLAQQDPAHLSAILTPSQAAGRSGPMIACGGTRAAAAGSRRATAHTCASGNRAAHSPIHQ